MRQNISKQISVDDVANVAKTSVSTLKRIFLRYTDIPVHKYFTSMKLKAATELLQNGSSVTDTADFLGFCSQAHFSKVYKNITGKNPSEIRGCGHIHLLLFESKNMSAPPTRSFFV